MRMKKTASSQPPSSRKWFLLLSILSVWSFGMLDCEFVAVLPRVSASETKQNTNVMTPKKQQPRKQNEPPQQDHRRKKKLKRHWKQNAANTIPPPTIRDYHKGYSSRTMRMFRKLSRLFSHHTAYNSEKNDADGSKNEDSYDFNPYYDPKRAFEMGVLSTLSYWEFHKWPTPNNATSFSLKARNYSPENNPDSIPKDISFTQKILSIATKFHLSRGAILRSHPITFSLHNNDEENDHHRGDAILQMKRNHCRPNYSFDYFFYNWHEPTGVKGVNFHDTDVLISTANTGSMRRRNRKSKTRTKKGNSSIGNYCNHLPPDTLVISFAGTASVADAVTNVQTFEPANHSLFFEPKYSTVFQRNNDQDIGNKTRDNISIVQGSLHRGFLNAYSRVQRGSVLRLSTPKAPQHSIEKAPFSMAQTDLLQVLHRRFGHCYDADDLPTHEGPKDEAVSSDASAPGGIGIQNQDEETEENIDDESTRDSSVSNREATYRNKSKKQETKRKKKSRPGCQVTNQPRRKSRGESQVHLSVVLKELVEDALSNGYTVHITGHSLGGALASLLALDVIVNPMNATAQTTSYDSSLGRLHLWTFGAPQIADSLFLESITNEYDALRKFLGKEPRNETRRSIKMMIRNTLTRYFRKYLKPRIHYKSKEETSSRSSLLRTNDSTSRKKQYHRYVTVSDTGKVDAVSEVAKNTLAAHKETLKIKNDSVNSNNGKWRQPIEEAQKLHSNPIDIDDVGKYSDSDHWELSTSDGKKKEGQGRRRKKWDGANVLHGKVAQSLGGVSRGGEVTHFVEAHYLWTPDQHHRQQLGEETDIIGDASNEDTKSPPGASETTNTKSPFSAHSMSNYLMGISRESGPMWHPLIPDVPQKWLEFMEIEAAIAAATEVA